MAHEIDFSRNRRGGMLSVKETPWHGHGLVVDRAPASVAELFEMLPELDFTVVKEPTFVRQPDGTFVESKHAYVTIRTDTGAELGAVGDRYHPVQNRDAFSALNPLFERGLVTVETAGALRGGADVWMLARFDLDSPAVQDVFGDEVKPYGLISNNHNGRRVMTIQETPIRVVCANTLAAATSKSALRRLEQAGKAVRIKHTKTATDRAQEAVGRVWGKIVERYDLIAQEYAILKATHLSEQEMGRLVLDLIAPLPEKEPETARGRTFAEKTVEKRERVMQLWDEGDGHAGDRTAWEAFNAVAQSLDHDTHLWPTRGADTRLSAMLDGSIAQKKEVVLNALLEHALETTEGMSMLDRIVNRAPQVGGVDLDSILVATI